jgi:hypothetical protein
VIPNRENLQCATCDCQRRVIPGMCQDSRVTARFRYQAEQVVRSALSAQFSSSAGQFAPVAAALALISLAVGIAALRLAVLRQLLGGNDRTIDVGFSVRPAAAHNAGGVNSDGVYRLPDSAAREMVAVRMVLPVIEGIDEMDNCGDPGYASRAAQASVPATPTSTAGESGARAHLPDTPLPAARAGW